MWGINTPSPVIIGRWSCEVHSGYTWNGAALIERIDPHKMSLYGQMTLHYFWNIKEWREILVISIVKRLKQIILQILERSYLENSWEEDKKYYIELIQNIDKLDEFLKYKIWWIYRNIITRIPKGEEKEIKRSLFHSYLVSELTYIIKYFEEFIFIQTNKNPDSFAVVLERYKHILGWWIMKFKTLMPASDGDDLYQEFCIVLWNCINKWNWAVWDHSKRKEALWFEPYLRRSIQNKVKDIHRSQSAQKRMIGRYTSIWFIDNEDNFLWRLVQASLAREWEKRRAEELL